MDYFALGGQQRAGDLAAYLAGGTAWSAREHDRAAQALNEACSDLGHGYPADYSQHLNGD